MGLARKEIVGRDAERGVIGRYGIARAEILFRGGSGLSIEYIDRLGWPMSRVASYPDPDESSDRAILPVRSSGIRIRP